MGDVGVWDPKAGPGLGEPAPGAPEGVPPVDLVRKAAAQLDADGFGLDAAERTRLAPWMTADPSRWESVADGADAGEIVAWIRFFTLAEAKLAGFEAGAKSPVVPLARALRRRGEYPADLTRWIKAHTSNRFLPHGSLMDRLNR